MAEQKIDDQATPPPTTKLVLPQGTTASAAIEISNISAVHVFKRAGVWEIEITLKIGLPVTVRWSPGNAEALSAHATIDYPQGHPDSEQLDSDPDSDQLNSDHDSAPNEATQEAAPVEPAKIQGSGAKKKIKLDEFSKLAKTPLEKTLSKASSAPGKFKEPKN
jgi:hypothetical protein